MFLDLRDVGRQLVTLKCHQRSKYLRAQIAFDSLLIFVRRGQTLSVASFLDVQSKLQIISESTIATAAGQSLLTTYPDRYRTIHHGNNVAMTRIDQMRFHGFVVVAPKVARSASVTAGDLETEIDQTRNNRRTFFK